MRNFLVNKKAGACDRYIMAQSWITEAVDAEL